MFVGVWDSGRMNEWVSVNHFCSKLCVCVCVSQWKKAEEKLQKELLEAEASESKDKKLKLVRRSSFNTDSKAQHNTVGVVVA